MNPRTRRVLQQAQVTGQALPRVLFPQWLRTLLLTLVWLGTIPVYIQLISTYSIMPSARTMAVGLAMFAGLAPHVWPTRTAPWRTVLWAWGLSVLTGMIAMLLGAGPLGLTAATLVGFAVVILRINENGRKMWNLFQTWRQIR